MTAGVRENNELNNFCLAASHFSSLLALPLAASGSTPSSSECTAAQQRDAMFNMASLLHMQGHLSLVLPLLHALLLAEGGAKDMTSHAFLWSLAQGFLSNTQQEGGEADRQGDQFFLRSQVVGVYSSLARSGDIMAQHKLRALTGADSEIDRSDCRVAGKGNPQYASLIFDHMAPVFEKRLVNDLKYDCPWRMKTLIGA